MLRGKVGSDTGHFWRAVGSGAAKRRKERGGDGRNEDSPFPRCLVTPSGLGRFFPKEERSITKFLEVSLFQRAGHSSSATPGMEPLGLKTTADPGANYCRAGVSSPPPGALQGSSDEEGLRRKVRKMSKSGGP